MFVSDVIHITDQEMVSSKFVLILLVVFATLAALGGLCCSVVWCMRVYRRQITKSFKGKNGICKIKKIK